VRQLLQPFESTPPEQLVQPFSHRPHRRSRPEVCADPEWIRALISKQASRFLEPTGYLFVDALHLRPSSKLVKQTALPG
jgi:hypothetical protein